VVAVVDVVLVVDATVDVDTSGSVVAVDDSTIATASSLDPVVSRVFDPVALQAASSAASAAIAALPRCAIATSVRQSAKMDG
jgi:hypothetical protein